MNNIYENINRFISVKESDGRSKLTINEYKIKLNKFADFIRLQFGTIDIMSITEDMIRAYKKYIIDIGNNNNTQRQKIVVLQCFFDWICKEPNFANYQNPMLRIELPRAKEVKKDFFNSDEAVDFIYLATDIAFSDNLKGLKGRGLASRDFVRNISFIIVALTSAIRVSPLTYARLSDYSRENFSLTCYRSKGNECVKKFLPKEAVNLINLYIDKYRPQGLPANAPLWVREYHEPYNPKMQETERTKYIDANTGIAYTELGRNEMTLIAKNYTRKLVGHELSMHEFRHSANTVYNEGGATLAEMQALDDHKSPMTTTKYIHSLRREEEEKRVADKIWGALLRK